MVSIIIILKWHLQAFSKKDIEVEVADGVLTIRSVKENEEDDSNLYRGISYTESLIESLLLLTILLLKMPNYKMVF